MNFEAAKQQLQQCLGGDVFVQQAAAMDWVRDYGEALLTIRGKRKGNMSQMRHLSQPDTVNRNREG